MHITLDSTQQGDYPTPADVRGIIELYYKIVAATGYAGSLVLVINNLDGMGTYRWYIGPYTKDDFDANPNYVVDNLQKLNPGLEGIAGSGALDIHRSRLCGHQASWLCLLEGVFQLQLKKLENG